MNHKLLLFCLLLLAGQLAAQEPTLILPTGHNRSVRALEFLPNGQFFLSGGEDGLVKLWETASGRELYTFDHHGGAYVNAIAVSADGRRMVSGGEGSDIVLSQTFSGQDLWSKSDPDLGAVAVRALAIADSSVLIARGNVLLSRQLSDGTENWRLEMGRSSLTAMALSPDGSGVVLGDDSGRCTLVDLASGEEMDSWKALRKAIVWMKYAADGKTLYAAGEGNRIVKMVPEGGREIQTWRVDMPEPLKGAAISADGQWLATTHLSPDLFTDIKAQLWKINGGSLQPMRTLDVGRTDYALAFTPDSQHLLTGQINTGEIAMQQIADGKMERKFTRHSETVHHLEATRYFLLTASQDLFGTARGYSLGRVGAQQFLEEDVFSSATLGSLADDGRLSFVAREDGEAVELWTSLVGEKKQAWPYDGFSLTALKALPAGKAYLTSDGQSVVRWATATGQPIDTFRSKITGIHELHYNASADLLAAAGDNGVAVWDMETGAVLNDAIAAGNLFTPATAAFSRKGQWLIAGDGDGKLEIWDLQNQQKDYQYQHDHAILAVAFSPDRKYFLLADEMGDIEVWRTYDNRRAGILKGHSKRVLDLVFNPDGSRLFSSSEDRTVRIWDVEAQEELGRIINWDDGEWAVSTPKGLFDASPLAMRQMYYVSPDPQNDSLEVIALDQLSVRFYEPGLLPKLIAPDAPPIRVVTDLKTVKLFPLVKGQIKEDELQLELEERAGGIGRVSIFLNQKELERDVNEQLKKRGAVYTINYDLSPHQGFLWAHPDSVNRVSVEVTGEEGDLSSQRKQWVYEKHRRARGNDAAGIAADWEGRRDIDPRLFIISVGTSDYKGERLDLSYPDQDAAYMAKALYLTGKRLFGEQGVQAHCLTTEEHSALEGLPVQYAFPTKTAIKKAFEAVEAEARPEDLVIAYFSGHGTALAADGDDVEFFYLSHDIDEEAKVKDAATRRSYTVSSAELTEWLKHIHAQKQALIMDACNSGAIVRSMTTGQKNLNTSQARAYKRMRDRAGLFLLSGSTADKKSYESSKFGQGLLTYALLAGMRGEGNVFYIDDDNAQLIDLMRLFSHARDKVPVLAESIREVQTPTLGFPRQVSSIYIGQFDNASEIPIGREKPVLVRPLFQGGNGFGDARAFNPELEKQLRREAQRGARAKWVFVDAYRYKNGYTLAGRYTTQGEALKLQANLLKDGQVVHTFDLPPKADTGQLAKDLSRALSNWMDEQGY
jgi:WD40 repeat protein/uncharacterized caspase-like protein